MRWVYSWSMSLITGFVSLSVAILVAASHTTRRSRAMHLKDRSPTAYSSAWDSGHRVQGMFDRPNEGVEAHELLLASRTVSHIRLLLPFSRGRQRLLRVCYRKVTYSTALRCSIL